VKKEMRQAEGDDEARAHRENVVGRIERADSTRAAPPEHSDSTIRWAMPRSKTIASESAMFLVTMLVYYSILCSPAIPRYAG
jgi:hypothetical protein